MRSVSRASGRVDVLDETMDPGLRISIERIVEIALHVDAFDNRLHNPVTVAHTVEVVRDVAGRDTRGMVRDA